MRVGFDLLQGSVRSPDREAESGRALPTGGKFYLCYCDHPNDRIYVENLLDFFQHEGIDAAAIMLNSHGNSTNLLHCLQEETIGILGLNNQLDRSWINSDNFLDLAERAQIPVIHWILDHSSSRWPQFENATRTNSRFLFLSPYSEAYFRRYALPGSRTSYTFSTGVSRHSRVSYLTRRDFEARPYGCLIALNLRRIGGTLNDALGRRDTLRPELASAVNRAIESGYFDLQLPIETHLIGALAERRLQLANDRFNFCLQIVEEVIQIRRRQWIFEIARDFPVLIQSDETAAPFVVGSRAIFQTNVDMETTFRRMKCSRAVLNVSHVNDEIHNRTINGLNAGCVNIVEDNVVHRGVFKHGKDALLFRYNDGSLRECLDLVCNDRSTAYEIGKEGIEMRDRHPFRFAGFDNIVKLARAGMPARPDEVAMSF